MNPDSFWDGRNVGALWPRGISLGLDMSQEVTHPIYVKGGEMESG